MRLTSIEKLPRRRVVNLHTDSGVVLSLSAELATQLGLRAGDELSDEQLQEMRRADDRHRAMSAALRLLAYRPRSEMELRLALARRRGAADVVQEVLSRLRELKLVDDEAFARAWVDSRVRTSPRGVRLIASELRQKGVERKTIERALAGLDEAEAAYRAAARRARSLAASPYSDFRRRLGELLLRRGFAYEQAQEATRRLWEELRAGGREEEKR